MRKKGFAVCLIYFEEGFNSVFHSFILRQLNRDAFTFPPTPPPPISPHDCNCPLSSFLQNRDKRLLLLVT
uniref:Uncharacterized protein n=1 Tax=Lepeophtheirus salmonis TaxID=72036 RepID=A0A0K2TL32_LEPSM